LKALITSLVRNFQELSIEAQDFLRQIYDTILYAIENPINMLLLFITYAILFIILSAFYYRICAIFGWDSSNSENLNDKTRHFEPLFVIYEEENEDEDEEELKIELLNE